MENMAKNMKNEMETADISIIPTPVSMFFPCCPSYFPSSRLNVLRDPLCHPIDNPSNL